MTLSLVDFSNMFSQEQPSQFIFINKDGAYRGVTRFGMFDMSYTMLKDYEHETNNYYRIVLEVTDNLPIFVHKELDSQKI